MKRRKTGYVVKSSRSDTYKNDVYFFQCKEISNKENNDYVSRYIKQAYSNFFYYRVIKTLVL